MSNSVPPRSEDNAPADSSASPAPEGAPTPGGANEMSPVGPLVVMGFMLIALIVYGAMSN